MRVLDLYAGPGGWDEGIKHLGWTVVGLDINPDACATAKLAGHRRVKGDLTQLDPVETARWLFHEDGCDLVIGSPPCQGFTIAGKGRGREDSELMLSALRGALPPEPTGDQVAEVMTMLRDLMKDSRSLHVLEVLRWIADLLPTYVALEQVPPVLPLWQEIGRILSGLGYSVQVGMVHAEQHGVPQTRKRAVLVASRVGPAKLPVPTHSRYHSRDKSRLDPGVLPWISMADALEFGLADRPAPTITGGGTVTGGAEPISHLSRYVSREDWVMRSSYGSSGDPKKRGERGGGEPAATVTGKVGRNRWVPRFFSQTGTPVDEEWPFKRPALTVTGRGLVPNPGATANATNGSTKSRNDGVRVTVVEAGLLQGFPADYPWQGSEGAQYQQVGDAVPPPLARAIITTLVGGDLL